MPRPKGTPKTGGRKKGTPNKLTKTVKDVYYETFIKLQSDPKVKLVKWAKENPTEFYKLSSKLIPAAVDAKVEVEGVEQVFVIGGKEIKL